jgi:hypothetical protein
LICSFNFLIFLAVCLNISTVINIKILTNSNQQTLSYKFTSHIAAFLSGFDHRDAWNLHTNIIWSKRSTDFKELSPCSVWYPLELYVPDTYLFRTLKLVTRRFGLDRFQCNFQIILNKLFVIIEICMQFHWYTMFVLHKL